MKLGLKKLSVLVAVLLLILAVMTGCSGLTHRDSDIEAPKATAVDDVIDFVELDDRTFGVRMNETAKMKGEVTEINIPSNYFGVPVTHILEDGFNGASSVEIISIPSSIKTVGKNAFAGCNMLRSLSLSSVESIGETAFSGCAQLSTVTLGNKLSALEAGTFKGCKNLSALTIPDSVVEIATDAFSGCVGLKTLTVGTGIVEMDVAMLADCKALETVTFSKNISDLDVALFAGCTSLKTITVHAENPDYMTKDGILYNKQGTQILYVPLNVSGEVTVSEGVVNIGASVFAGRKSLASITLPGSVKTINETSFLRCTGLKSVVIGNGVTNINQAMFADCSALETISVDGSNENYVAQDGILYERETGKISFVPANLTGDVTLREGVKAIDANTFAGRKALKSVTLSKSVERIGEAAFFGCVAMESFTIEEGVKFIDASAFAGCDVLKTIVIGSDVETIAAPVYLAFDQCAVLESIVVSEYNQFYASKDGILYNKPVTEILFVPAAITGDITLANGLIEIADKTFENRTGLTSVTIPASVKAIGETAFVGCAEGLIVIENQVSYVGKWVVACDAAAEDVVLRPDTVGIAKSAFAGCVAMKKITIGETLAFIADDAFDACAALEIIVVSEKNPNFASKDGILYNKPVTKILCVPAKVAGEVTVLDGVAVIEENAFAGRSGITKITLPESVKSVGANAFKDCSVGVFTEKDGVLYIGKWVVGFTDKVAEALTFADDTVGIANGAFFGCSQIKKVVIGKNIAFIGDSAFDNCAALEAVEVEAENRNYVSKNGILYNKPTTAILAVPAKLVGDVVILNGVTEIGAEAFKNRADITSVTLPVSLKSIGANAFDGCTKMIQQYVNGVTYIGNWALKCDAANMSIVLKAGTVGVVDSAFADCKLVERIKLNAELAYISEDVFANCAALKKIEVAAENANYISDCGILYDRKENVILCVPAKLGSKIVSIRAGVTKIDAGAFANRTGVEKFVIPESVVEIGEGAFDGCTALSRIDVYAANENYASDGGILYNKTFTEILCVPKMISGEVEIASGVEEITADTFAGCKNITALYISASVTEIDAKAFDTCEKLATIVVDGDNTMYCSKDGVLYNNPVTKIISVPQKLQGEIEVLEGVNSIGTDTFANREITKIEIPVTIFSIDKDAFATCQKLQFILVDENNVEYRSADGILYDKEGTDIICVPATILGNVTILEGITAIDNYEFANRTGLSSIVLPEGVVSIGISAFYGCSKLETVVIPSTVESIATAAFYKCNLLDHVVIPDAVTRIESDVFGGCTALTEITIGKNVESIGAYAFADCPLLQKITIPETVEHIDDWAFALCTSLVEVVFENTENWTVDGEVIDVIDPLQAAIALVSTYCSFEWNC